jgi:L-fuconate dehydratase
LPERARAALADGFTHLKVKVGGDLERDLRRARLVRDAIGPANRLSLDANQAWGVEQAIEAIGVLSEVDPWWIEEPTSPDDVLGHRRIRDAIAPVRVATGEHVQNRVVFKQLLQLGAIDICQLDCCRLGGVNEVLAVVLLAAKFGVPICPHAGGVGLCEYAQHVSMFDYVAVGATLDDRVCEFVDHLLVQVVDELAHAVVESRADDAGLQHRDPARVAVQVRVSARHELVEGASSRMTTVKHRST